MDGRRAFAVVGVMAVVAILAGCASPGAGSLAPDTTSPSPQATAPPTAEPTRAIPSPSAPLRATPKPTPSPMPPKPSGVRFESESEGTCSSDPREMCSIDAEVVTVSWRAPRTKGVEVRVYGITKCLGTDSDGAIIDGRCLREHSVLPSSVMTLLANVPASKGEVTLSMFPSGDGLADTARGKTVYSFVLAAYNAAGEPSVFAIAATEEYCATTEVPCDISQGGVTMTGEAATGDSSGQLLISVRMAGLAPGEGAALKAVAQYTVAWTCGEGECSGDGLCGPAHVEETAGTATATVRAEADADGRASPRVRLVAPPPAATCPVDPEAPWYGGGESWTRIIATDSAHDLSLTLDAVDSHVVY